MRKNKKAVSTMIEYVLLIVIAISLSAIVYVWLKNYIPKTPNECSEDISLVVSDYNCTDKKMTLIIVNKGNFNVDGYIFRIQNRDNGPFYEIRNKENELKLPVFKVENYFFNLTAQTTLKPNEEYSQIFDYSSKDKILKIEILPFKAGKEILLCNNARILQEVQCN